MALTVTALDSIQSTSNASTYASASFAAGAAGRAVFMWVLASETSGTVPTPYITSHSDLPFELIGVGVGTNPLTDSTEALALYGCLATGTASDTFTIDFDGNAQAGCCASTFEVSGFDSAPAVIGDAVAQLELATFTSAATATVTLDSFADADDIYLLAIGLRLAATEDITPETDATQIHDLGHGSPNRSLFTSYKANDTSATANWTNASTGLAGAAVINSTGVVSGTDDFIVHNQVYNEVSSSSALSFAPSVTPTTGNTLVVCVTVEHFEATTYTPGNSYTLMTDPDVSTMTYEIANSAFDRQLWYSKVADGDDNFELAAGSGTGGWNLAYWELDGEFEIASVVSTYNTGSTRTLDPSAIADPGSDDIVYTIGWSAVHFEGAADPVTFTGIGTGALIDRGDIASDGGTKAQTSAADRSWNNGNILNQNVVISNNAITGPRNTCVAWVPVGGATTVTPTTVASVFTVPTPTIQAGAVVTPATVASVFAVPTPTAIGETAVTPATVASVMAVDTPTILAAATVTPATVVSVFTVDTPTILAGALVEPGTVVTVFTVPTPTIDVSGAGVVTPDTVTGVYAVPTPTILGEALVTPDTVASAFTVPTPTIDVSGGATTVTPDTVTGVYAVPTPTIEGLAVVTPATVVVTDTVPTPTIQGLALVSPATVATLFTVPTPSILAGALVTPATVASVFAVPTSLAGLIVVTITNRLSAMFYRNTDKTQLALVPIGNSQPIGFKRLENWERVSSRFHMNQGTADTVMALTATAWAAHSGSAQATLLAAINQALQTAGYRGPGGIDLA